MSQTYNRSIIGLMLVGGCLAMLGGCHKKPTAPPPAPVSALPAAPKPSEPPPARQLGLWQTTISEAGSEDMPQILQICIDAMTDAHLGVLGTDLSGDTCKKTVSRTGDSWGLVAECNMGTGGVDSYSGSISGDLASDFTMKLRSQTTGASLPQMNRVTNYTVVSKRLGPCSGDQKPGDVVNEGVKLNLFDMAGVHRPGKDDKTRAGAGKSAPGDAGAD